MDTPTTPSERFEQSLRSGNPTGWEPNAFADFVNSRPVAATLVAAAAGAGIVALMAMAARDQSPSLRDRFARTASRAADSDRLASLKSQLSDLLSSLASRVPSMPSMPSKREATRAANDAADQAKDQWEQLREQSQGLLKQVQPHLDTAADIARSNPIWTSVAIGVLGALLGSQLLGGKTDD